ncbi:NADP-dependent isocitrate dehydrogenase [Aestuariimicrobium sp. T2.26MG-19.2B]|uniref:NADP-dependent isocitrate dehydrogenase n=1 Tax=Aestuariimicrobium sp. T2.26MG-19.2B TaxID=3040679 RepID=UPI00247744CD|nr:NADP-dependent isocitrate dehydrogenase [Aestuariimicrobium sp. T2.26MG-19.2B]CAI9407180.1 Isocitrate dehydrogenase [NADP] [Aestuariimicrobium sp. T2.26MG-19.2B]
MTQTIHWTKIDEAPALATHSFLPIVQSFLAGSGIEVVTSDISLAGRILAQFPERLAAGQQVADNLAELGALTLKPEATIIKLPNISASVPQLKAAIAELQSQGFDVPDFPENPTTADEADTAARYAKVLGSAVNPVLREGNSDRRAPASVKNFARKHPHRLGPWTPANRASVVSMADGDFYGHEQSVVTERATTLSIVLQTADGTVVLKDAVPTLDGEIVDATFMSAARLRAFYAAQIEKAKSEGLLLSLHLKATMMKVSDPVMFGHAVSVFYEPVLTRHAAAIAQIGFNPNQGIGDLYAKLPQLDQATADQIRADIDALYAERPALAMVDSDKGITNLHVPSDVIIDASLPVVIRDSGQMWDAKGGQQQTLAMVPDRSYGPMYEAVIAEHKRNGALDPATIGSVPNVGLMAQKAEEYGSHPTTFVIPEAGRVQVLDGDTVVMEHEVEAGDIWRMSRVRDIPVQDWVKLAVSRARATGAPAVFYLDAARAHDANLIAKVKTYLADHDTEGLDLQIMAPVEAITFCLARIREGKDAISVTGNVLRDYLTDLFPILELGTSAKMLSIVPLLAGGGLFETGAGGSAPKHVQQFVAENYLRWDSLGEFSALGAALEHLAAAGNPKAQVLADALDRAIGTFLDENRSPARRVGQIDNRGSHYYLASYWARAVAEQDADPELRQRFAPIAQALADNEETINAELIGVQGHPVDIGGYYHPDEQKVQAAMRPSSTLNSIIGL